MGKTLIRWSTDELETAVYSGSLDPIQKYEAERENRGQARGEAEAPPVIAFSADLSHAANGAEAEQLRIYRRTPQTLGPGAGAPGQCFVPRRSNSFNRAVLIFIVIACNP